jgi:flavodoxin
MDVLVVYDTGFGNTARIAEAIASTCGGNVQPQSAIDPGSLPRAGLLIVGSPTLGGRPTAALQQWLDGIRPGALATWRVAAFDTRLSAEAESLPLRLLMGVIGYAAPRIAHALEARGGKAIAAPHGFIVEGRQGPLLPGEIDRARSWGRQLSLMIQSVEPLRQS